MLLAKTLRSSTLRLALIYIGLFSAALFLLIGYVYWSTASFVRGRYDHAIAAELAAVRQAYESAGRDGLIASITQRMAERRFEDGVYLLADAQFAAVTGNLGRWPAALRDASGWESFAAPEWNPGAARRPLLRATYETLADGSHLLIGRDVGDLDEFVAAVEIALGLGVALMFVFAGVAGASITRRTVGRIEAINAISHDIMRRGLGRRVPLRGTHDEWDQLAENLNSMLDRIKDLVQEVRQVSDNIAHDLRTPLNRLRGRLEKAHDRNLDAEQYKAVVGDAIQELDAILRMFASLIRISQIEAHYRRAAFRAVDLAEVAGGVVELFDAVAEAQGGHVVFAGNGAVYIAGDRDLLFDAVANLVDNALKHGGDKAQVVVEVRSGSNGAVIAVADRGPGIPRDERSRVLKRFYRLEPSRRAPGNGLGLSLVAAVANLHGARIAMSDNAPGLIVRLEFPASQRASAGHSDQSGVEGAPLAAR